METVESSVECISITVDSEVEDILEGIENQRQSESDDDSESSDEYLEELRDSFNLDTSVTEDSKNAYNEPVYEGADVTILESHLLALQFAIRHCLSSKAFGELLHLLSCHLPLSARSQKSVHLLKQFFLEVLPQVDIDEQQYCRCCY